MNSNHTECRVLQMLTMYNKNDTKPFCIFLIGNSPLFTPQTSLQKLSTNEMGLDKSTLIHIWHCDASWALKVAH